MNVWSDWLNLASFTSFGSRIEASIRCTIIDSRHAEFETRFGKVHFSLVVTLLGSTFIIHWKDAEGGHTALFI